MKATQAQQWKRITVNRQDRLDAAIAEYNLRQSRENHPEGSFDSKGRWYPSETERCECCDSIREPSRNYPYSLNKHCRSIEHLACLYDVDPNFLRKAVKKESTREKLEARVAYKAVYAESGRYYSCFDGTEWKMRKTRREAAKSGHHGGFYVYSSIEAAANAAFPIDSVHSANKVLQVEVKGRVVRYDGGKMAYSYCKPLQEIASII